MQKMPTFLGPRQSLRPRPKEETAPRGFRFAHGAFIAHAAGDGDAKPTPSDLMES
jgi:hypothetical protein